MSSSSSSSRITIVIPVYNRAGIVGRTLRSIERQRLRPERVVLVDNASTDDSLAVMEAWRSDVEGRLDVVIVTESKPGACAARNRGLQEVGTEFVMFFDSDDEMLPSHVEEFAAAIERNPNADIFGRSIECEEPDGSCRRLYFTSRRPMFNHLFRGCLSTQRIVVRTSLVRAVGAWNEELPAWNDYELGVRLLLSSDKIVELSGESSVVTYHLADSITGTSYSARHERWELSLDRVEALLRASDRGRKFAGWVDVRRMILAAQYRAEADLSGCSAAERENAMTQASRLRREVVGRVDCRLRMMMIYLHNLYFKRLTWAFARMLFPRWRR